MVSVTQAKAEAEGLRNVRTYLRDFVTEGTGLPPSSMDYAMLFNILHAEQPERLFGDLIVSWFLAGSWASSTGTTIRHAARAVDGDSPPPRTVPRLGRQGGLPALASRNRGSAAIPLRNDA